jgi:hypothetical protein
VVATDEIPAVTRAVEHQRPGAMPAQVVKTAQATRLIADND